MDWDQTKNDAYREAALLFLATRAADFHVRAAAARDLEAYVELPGVVERLTQLLDDEDTAVIETAAKSLASRGTVARVRSLISVLAGPDGDADIGYAIRDALLDLGVSSPLVRRACEQIARDSESDLVRREADILVKALPALEQ